jgi:hypothetical protein
LGLADDEKIDKHNPEIDKICEWVKEQYLQKRTTCISPQELIDKGRIYLHEYFAKAGVK